MGRISCRKLWRGTGEPLSGAVVNVNQSGLISGIESCPDTDSFEYDFAMPAFFDAHCHFLWMVLKEISLDLSGASSAEDLLEQVREAADNCTTSILRGESWDQSSWTVPDLPSLEQLDKATGTTPVFLCRVCGHTGLVNSAMLDLLEEDSPEINRKTGQIFESAVLNFTRRFPPSPELVQEAVSQVAYRMHSMGVTGICTIEKPENIDVLLLTAPELDVNFVIQNRPPWTSGGYRGSTFTKLFLDGSFGACTAALDTASKENLIYTDENLLKILIDCGRNGLDPVVHAIGAAALAQIDRVSLMAFRELGRGFPIRIEHAEDLLSVWPGTWDRRYHTFSMQPNFVERWQRPGGMYDGLVSSEHAVRLNPFQTVLSAGFRLGFGSDSMPLDPLYGLRGAVQHRNPAESLSVAQALRAYTLDAASISGNEKLALPLQTGRAADLVFLSGDPFDGTDELYVVGTMRRGKMVFTGKGEPD